MEDVFVENAVGKNYVIWIIPYLCHKFFEFIIGQ